MVKNSVQEFAKDRASQANHHGLAELHQCNFSRLGMQRQLTGKEEIMEMNSLVPLVAYFDPGSGSLVLQAMVGGAAGLFVFAKYLWASAPALFHGRKPPRNPLQ